MVSVGAKDAELVLVRHLEGGERGQWLLGQWPTWGMEVWASPA